jgi:hypothetical protein
MNKMTELTWDSDDIAREFPNIQTLGELITATSDKAREQGEFVCAVEVNGMFLNEEQETNFDKVPMGEVKKFAIRMQTLKVLLDESLVQCADFLGQLTISLESAAQMFRAEDLTAAHKFYRTCVDGAQLFVEMMTHYKIAYQNSFGPCPSSWILSETRMGDVSRQILEAYRQKNYILVADLLEYELSPILSQWRVDLTSEDKDLSDSKGEGISPTQSSNC